MMKLTQEQMEQLKQIGRMEIPPKHTGWMSYIDFRPWEGHGLKRLYYNFSHYNRDGRPSGHSQGKGFIDLNTGEVQAPPSDKRLIRKILSEQSLKGELE